MPIGIHDLKPAEGSTHRRKRVGRGIGSGHGKTSGRGHKGNKARGQVNPNFEGGQTPLHRRLPQLKGFKPVNKKVYALVNLYTLEENFEAGAEITPESLMASGLVRNLRDGLKILGDGAVSKKFTVRAHKFSQSAQEKLQAAGGTVERLPVERKKQNKE
jgi:large subunit ribosomal protein L15